jgi:hypothetical protein
MLTTTISTTREAARQLGVTYTQLHYLINTNRMPAPRKNVSGGYEWLPEDIERARVALANWRKGEWRR